MNSSTADSMSYIGGSVESPYADGMPSAPDFGDVRLGGAWSTPPLDFKGRLSTWAAITEFIWAGNATFTLVSMKSGTRFTYRVKAKKADVLAHLSDVTYFVSLLRGQDNEGDYAYVGVMRKPAQFNLTSASRVTRTAESVRLLLWFFDKMARQRDVLNKAVEFWHTGSCGCCGRALTVPSSVLTGFGPVCDGKRGRL